MKYVPVFSPLILAVGLLAFGGCAANQEANVNRDLPGQNRHSSMPHNLPQSWEGQGMMGGLAGYR